MVILDTSTNTYSTTFKNWVSSSYGNGIKRVELGKPLEGRLKTLPDYLSKHQDTTLGKALTYFGQNRLGGIASGTTSYGGPFPTQDEMTAIRAFYNPQNNPNIQLKFTTDGLHVLQETNTQTCPYERMQSLTRSSFVLYNEVRKEMQEKLISREDLTFAREMLIDTESEPAHLLQEKIRSEKQVIFQLFNPLNDPAIIVSFHEDGIHISQNETTRNLTFQAARTEIAAKKRKIKEHLRANFSEGDTFLFFPGRIEHHYQNSVIQAYSYEEVAESMQTSKKTAKDREAIQNLFNPDKSPNIEITRYKHELRVATYDHVREKLLSIATYSYENVIECIQIGKTPDPQSVQSCATHENDTEKKIRQFFNPTNDPRISVSFEEQGKPNFYDREIRVTGRDQLHPSLPQEECYSWNQVYRLMSQEAKIRKFFGTETELYFTADTTTIEEYDYEAERNEKITTEHQYVYTQRRDHASSSPIDQYELGLINFLIKEKENIEKLFNPENSENIEVVCRGDHVAVLKYRDDVLIKKELHTYERVKEGLASGQRPKAKEIQKSESYRTRSLSVDSDTSTVDWGEPQRNNRAYRLLEMENTDFQ